YKAVLTIVLGFMLTIPGVSSVFRNQIEKFFNKLRKDEIPDMTEDLEKVQLQTSNKLKDIVKMVVDLGVFVTLSSVGAGAFGIRALLI
ncbi:sulfite exporter TauE/SafE family protein, partial [Acinetobacter johnsonii]